MILPQNVGLASWDKLRKEKELSSLDVILIKEKAFQETWKQCFSNYTWNPQSDNDLNTYEH